MSSTSHDQSGIQVSVAPSQSAFFAGETFTVSITFTNTRRPVSAHPQPRSASAAQTHRRGVHSVSSVPLARPPTSPGSPKTASAAANFATEEDTPHRKRRGVVGQTELQNPRVSAVAAEDSYSSKKKKRGTLKSLSVSITPTELVERLVGKPPNSNPASPDLSVENLGQPDFTAVHAAHASTRFRDANLPVHPSHPHARKQSVQDFQVQEVATPFALSLDPIAEHSVSISTPGTPFVPSPIPPSSSLLNGSSRQSQDSSTYRQARSDARTSHGRKGSISASGTDLGLGRPSTLSPASIKQPRSAFSSTFSPPGTEVLLWAYAQLSGTVELEESILAFDVVDGLKDRLLTGGAVGRGSMDIGSTPSPSTGFLTSFLPQRSPRSPHLRHQRASPSLLSSLPSFGLSSLFSPARLSPFSSSSVARPEDGNLPTLDLQPSVLAVDLTLLPGESRTYKYTVILPVELPPTFRGKAVRFAYELIVGTSHAPSTNHLKSPSAISAEHHRKKVMKIPIRVYNFVSVHNALQPYELLWPSHKGRPERQAKVEEDIATSKRRGEVRNLAHRRPSAAIYARQLVQDFSERDGETRSEDEEDVWSCREAVEILTRNSRKVSYDIAKDGDQVAVLTLVKSSYRVGETISGIAELNTAWSSARVLKFSAFLEAHEQLPVSFANSRKHDLRRVHAEYHSTVTPNTVRLPFSLDVPSDASPAFQFSATGLSQGNGGLQWRVRICFLVAAGSSQSRHLTRDGYEDDWGVAWRAASALTPMVARVSPSPSSMPSTPVPGAWSVQDRTSAEIQAQNVDDHDWRRSKAETVECEIPLAIWPGNTLFRPVETVFGA